MPFKDDLFEVYKYAIKPACEEAGWQCVRVDELKGSFSIHKKIIEYIFKSKAVIADLTANNPNVFYEMGVAHSIDNKTILIKQDDKSSIPFDLTSYNCIFYKQNIDGLKELKAKIVESLNHIDLWKNDSTNPVQDFKPFKAVFTKNEVDKEIQDAIKNSKQVLEKLKAAYQQVLKTKETIEADRDSYKNKLDDKQQALDKLRAEYQQVLKTKETIEADIDSYKNKLDIS
jgi:hypothetical protein